MNRPIAASVHPERSASAFRVERRDDGDRVFRAAKRHSRRVRMLRYGLPTLAVVGIAVFYGASWLNPAEMFKKLPANFDSIVVSGTKITMQAPRLAGFTRDSRPYEVNARAAAQDLKKPDMIELQDLSGSIEMQDKAVFRLSAKSGLYNTKTEILNLSERIVVTTTSGYEGRLTEAFVDVRKGHIVSEKPVEVISARGTINANRLEILESGNLVKFENGVEVTLAPEDRNLRAPPSRAADAQKDTKTR